MKSYYAAHKETIKQRSSDYYEANKEACLAQALAWSRKHKEKSNGIKRKWYSDPVNRENRRATIKLWAIKNKERRKSVKAAWREANADRIRSVSRDYRNKTRDKERTNNAAYRARQLMATPKWADAKAIRAVYKRALELSKETGTIYHVDHIVPLKSKTVCGLHVEHNLQVITMVENMRKLNRHWPDMPEAS